MASENLETDGATTDLPFETGREKSAPIVARNPRRASFKSRCAAFLWRLGKTLGVI